MKEKVISLCWVISKVATERGKCTLTRDEVAFKKLDRKLDELIDNLRRVFDEDSGG